MFKCQGKVIIPSNETCCAILLMGLVDLVLLLLIGIESLQFRFFALMGFHLLSLNNFTLVVRLRIY